MSTAIVVGAGPNGLAAAVALAKAGVAGHRPGSRRRNRRRHPHQRGDHSRPAARPLLGDPPDGRRLAVPRRARASIVTGCPGGYPEIDCVHPLDGGSAGVLYRSVEATADGLGADGARWRRAVRPAVGEVRRARRGHHGSAAAGAAASADAGPVRRADRAARLSPCPGVSHARGAGVVRRCCGACLPAAALPDDVGDRAGHSHRGASPRMAGRGGRFTVDHRRAGGAA